MEHLKRKNFSLLKTLLFAKDAKKMITKLDVSNKVLKKIEFILAILLFEHRQKVRVLLKQKKQTLPNNNKNVDSIYLRLVKVFMSHVSIYNLLPHVLYNILRICSKLQHSYLNKITM